MHAGFLLIVVVKGLAGVACGTGNPVVLDEFPLAGLVAVNDKPAARSGTMLSTLFTIGYAGAMLWAVDDTCCGMWSTTKTDVKAFADAKPCVTRY